MNWLELDTLQKVPITFIISISLSARIVLPPTGSISVKFVIEDLMEIC